MMFSSTACRAVLFLLSLSLGGASANEPLVDIGTAGNYVMLTKAGISTVPASAITGDIGVSPIAATAMTGFDLSLDSGGQYSTSIQLTGKAVAASFGAPISALLTTAVSDMEAAYTDAAGRPNPNATRTNLNGGTLGGVYGGATAPLTPGVYTFGSNVQILGTIYFEGTGNIDEDVFIVQMTGNLRQAANTEVILSGGALARNIFWQVAGYVSVGVGAHMEGILLVKTDVLFKTGSSLSGRILAQTRADLQTATIVNPASAQANNFTTTSPTAAADGFGTESVTSSPTPAPGKGSPTASPHPFSKQPIVDIQTAGNYVMLTKTGISTVPTSAITGDIGVWPIAATAMTGFSPTLVGEYSTSAQLTGKAYAANYATPTPRLLTIAVNDMQAAYFHAGERANPDTSRHDLNEGTLGGAYGGATAKLTPGVYTFNSSVTIGATIYFEGTGTTSGQGDTDVFIIQITGDLLQVQNTQVLLSGGALARNIFWQVEGYVSVGVGAHMEGILLVKTDVMFKTGSSLSGRILAQTRADLQMATITEPPSSQENVGVDAVTSTPTASPTTVSPTTATPTVTTLAPTSTANFTANFTNDSASAPSAAIRIFFLSALSALLLSRGVTRL